MNKRILIADDDPAILDSLKILLEEEGYKVETSHDGRTAQELQEEFPDLILLDIWMSGMDGRDICKHLKSQGKTKHIPIVLISANMDTPQIAQESGADDFILKPFDIDYLLKKIETYV